MPRFFFPFSVNPSFLALTPFHLPSSFNQPPFRPPLPPPSPPPTPSALPLAHSSFTPAPSEPENKPESASRTSTERAPPPPRDRESSLPTPGASKENSPKKESTFEDKQTGMPSNHRSDNQPLCEELRPWGQLIRFRDPAVGPVSFKREGAREAGAVTCLFFFSFLSESVARRLQPSLALSLFFSSIAPSPCSPFFHTFSRSRHPLSALTVPVCAVLTGRG